MTVPTDPTRIRGLGVSFDGVFVLVDVTMDIAFPGVSVVVGPSGTGKSTFLRTLAGFNRVQPSFQLWGTIDCPGRVALAAQNARFYVDTVRENLVSALPNRSSLPLLTQTDSARSLLARVDLTHVPLDADVTTLGKSEQRRLAIARALATEPRLILLDEPTAGLDEEGGDHLVQIVRGVATGCSVLVVTHNTAHARRLGGTTFLLAGGRVVDHGPTDEFFTAPRSAAARQFVATGGCDVPSPNARREDLSDTTPLPPPFVAPAPAAVGPRGFFWAADRLGGVPRPGVVRELEEDLERLRDLGVKHLVTLEERLPFSSESVRAFGMEHVHFPIPDMGAPELERVKPLLADIERRASQAPVAVHCLAGLGRTGTILAAMLILRGSSAAEAIERVRACNPRCIQSQVQADFLRDLEIDGRGAGAVLGRLRAAWGVSGRQLRATGGSTRGPSPTS